MFRIKSLLKKNWPLIFFLGANVALFWPLYIYKLLPFPGDLLVSFFFPWSGGGFAGFNPWTTHKEYIASDVVRAIYPWKALVIDQFLAGKVPLWNPYNFSGSPLLANFQSGTFYPTNLLFLIFPKIAAWTLDVTVFLFLIALATYLFLRSLNLSKFSSVFGALVVSNLTYLITWHELLVISHTFISLPLSLWAINKYKETAKSKWLGFLSIFLLLAVFAGHVQTMLYVFVITILYGIFKRISIFKLIFTFGLTLILGSVQLFPSLEYYLRTAREFGETKDLYATHLFPWRNLITMFSPDFFGNPVTGNFWGWDYHNSLVYIGIVALSFIPLVFINIRKNLTIIFFVVLALIGLFFATNPLAFLLEKLPVFSTGIPARTIILFTFGLSILSAFGFEQWIVNKGNIPWKFLIGTSIFLLGPVIVLFLFLLRSSDPNLLVAKRNLIFPGIILVITILTLIGVKQFRKLFMVGLVILFFLAIGEYARFFNKITPFASNEFVFPEHPVIEYLQNKAGINRFYGVDTAFFQSNFSTYYHIFDAQGYDPLYIKSYSEFIGSANDGKIPASLSRVDAVLPFSDSFYRERAMDILGIKYILDKNDLFKSEWEPELNKFPPNKYQLVWQKSKWKIYERLSVLPRVFVTNQYEVIPVKSIISRLYDSNFDHKNKIILEDDLKLKGGLPFNLRAEPINYSPNKIVISLNIPDSGLLFLSDTYYPGWNAYVDGKLTKIYRADYTFRSVIVPKGQHEVEFRYEPVWFSYGLLSSLAGFLIVICLILKPSLKNIGH